MTEADPLDVIYSNAYERAKARVKVLEEAAKMLRRLAPQEATSSRDFGRGYMHAVRLLEQCTEDYLEFKRTFDLATARAQLYGSSD